MPQQVTAALFIVLELSLHRVLQQQLDAGHLSVEEHTLQRKLRSLAVLLGELRQRDAVVIHRRRVLELHRRLEPYLNNNPSQPGEQISGRDEAERPACTLRVSMCTLQASTCTLKVRRCTAGGAACSAEMCRRFAHRVYA